MKSSSQAVSKRRRRLLNLGFTSYVIVVYFVLWTTTLCIQRIAINAGDELHYRDNDATLCPPVAGANHHHHHHHHSISNNSQPLRRRSQRMMIQNTIHSIVERLEMEWNTTTTLHTPTTTSVNDDVDDDVDDDECTRNVLTNFHVPQQLLQAMDHSSRQVVTLVLATHLSIDKLYERLPIVVKFWAGPISLAIYIKEYGQILSLRDVLQSMSMVDQSLLIDGEIVVSFFALVHA